MFNQEVQRVDLQDEGGGRGGGEEVRGGQGGEGGEKRGGEEADGERGGAGEKREEEEERGTGGRRGGEGTEALDSVSVDFDLDLGPESEICRSPGSCWSEESVMSPLQVDNGSSESDEALQREEAQRRSRRRFRRINPRGEREVITTDDQEDGGLTTVRPLPVR